MSMVAHQRDNAVDFIYQWSSKGTKLTTYHENKENNEGFNNLLTCTGLSQLKREMASHHDPNSVIHLVRRLFGLKESS